MTARELSPPRPRVPATRRWLAWAVGAAVLAGAGWTVSALWTEIVAAEAGVAGVLWTVPILLAIHAGQLLLSTKAWRLLLLGDGPALTRLFGFRLIREGINSLLPVAHVGGEVVTVRLLARRGVKLAQAAAATVVDVTMEVCAQLGVLLAGLAGLAWISGINSVWVWAGGVGAACLAAGALLLGGRLGGLRLLEKLVAAIARQWPALDGSGLAGLNSEAQRIYRHPGRLWAAAMLQGTAWVLGTAESWLVLHALGLDVSLPQAFVVESLGAAARSAGFAVPGALAIQETGFVLAAVAVGLPETPALTLSFVKRVREVLVGAAGLVWWQVARRRG